jgi:tetratricopeptide (TPR) repeat protein
MMAIVALLGLPEFAWTDDVQLVGRPLLDGVDVYSYTSGKVVFRGKSGQDLRKDLADVVWLRIAGQTTFNKAEQLRKVGNWEAARSHYAEALGQAGRPWQRRLFQMRLLEAAGQAGRYDEAMATWVTLLGDDELGVAPPRPCRPAPRGHGQNDRALRVLESRLRPLEAGPVRAALRGALLELALYDGREPLPAVLFEKAARPATTQPTDAATTQPTTQPAWYDPEPVATQPAVDESLKLPADSWLPVAVERWLDGGEALAAMEVMEQGRAYVAEEQEGDWRLLAGRVAILAGEPAQAAADLLGVAEGEFPPGTRAQALYYVGVAHEKLSEPEIAQRMYERLVGDQATPEDVRKKAAADLKRLRGEDD